MRTIHSFERPRRPSLRCARAGAMLALAAAVPAHAADPPGRRAARALDRLAAERVRAAERIEVSWLDAASGSWFDAARWSGGVAPNNNAAFHYDARIDATGAPYTVALFDDALVSTLTLDSSDATLIPVTGDLHVIETLSVNAGSLRVGSHLRAGSLDLTGGDLTLAGGVVQLGSTLTTNGGQFRFRSGTIRNTVIDGADAGFILDGDQSKTFENSTITGGVLTVGRDQTVRLRGGFETQSGGGLLLDFGTTLEFDDGFTLESEDNIESVRSFASFRIVQGAEVAFEGGVSGVTRSVIEIEQDATLTIRNSLENPIFLDSSAGRLVNEGVVRNTAIVTDWSNQGVMERVHFTDGAIGENFGVIRGMAVDGGEWVNHGLIELQPFIVLPPSFNRLGGSGVNHGLIRVPEGRSGVISGDWTNEGVIDARNATLRIARTLDPAFFESVLATGGVVYLDGEWDNAGQSYSFPVGNGDWVLSNADVSGGAMRFTSDASVSSATFRDIALSGEIDFLHRLSPSVGRMYFEQGAVFDDLTVNANGSNELHIAAGVALDGVTINLNKFEDSTGSLLLENAHTHTLSPASAVIGTGRIGEWQRTGGGDASLVNEGLIRAEGGPLEIQLFEFFNNATAHAASGALDIAASRTINNGTMRFDEGESVIAPSLFDSAGVFENRAEVVVNPGAALILRNTLVNTGSVLADGGLVAFEAPVRTANLDGVRATGDGRISVRDLWDNRGDRFVASAERGVHELAGTIRGGAVHIESSDHFRLLNLSRIDGVAFSGEDLEFSGRNKRIYFDALPTFDDAAFVLGDGATLVLRDGETITESLPIRFDDGTSVFHEPPSTIRVDNQPGSARRLTIAAGGVIDGGYGAIEAATLENHGAILGSQDSFDITIQANEFRNHGLISDAGVDAPGSFFLTVRGGVNTGRIESVGGSRVDLIHSGPLGGFRNEGAIHAGADGRVRLRGVVNTGTISAAGGTIEVIDLRNDGVIDLRNGALRGVQTTGTTLENTGAITIGAAARMDSVDFLTLARPGALRIELNRDSLARETAFIDAGAVSLDGALEILLDGDFAWNAGRRITLISSPLASIDGEFDELLFPSLANGFTFELEYLPQRLDLIVTVPAPMSATPIALGALALTRRRRV